MQKFIGTKVVMAVAMTSGRASEYTGKPISSHEQGRSGYLVEYPDGYKSWSPKDVFEAAYRLCETPQQRLQIEKDDLSDKLKKLEEWLSKDKPAFISDIEWSLQQAQLVVMKQYQSILHARTHGK